MFKKTVTLEMPAVLYWLFVAWMSLNVIEWSLRVILNILNRFV